MDVEVAFPALADLARKFRTSLQYLAGESAGHDGYCSLRDCCWMAMRDLPRHSHADGIDYLATINTYLSIPWSVSIPPAELWRRLCTGNQSMFLDTLSELAWALTFHHRGISFEAEAKFFTDPAKQANADFLIGSRGAGLWLDVNSMELAPLSREAPAGPRPAFPSMSKSSVDQQAGEERPQQILRQVQGRGRRRPSEGSTYGAFARPAQGGKGIHPGPDADHPGWNP